ncbi:MAG TPA: YidC/Oxa1 family membrane protein insertase [Candidatus Paceibacterota bacterium]
MFTTLLVQPIYNAFIFLLGIMPGGDVGLAIIAVTLLVRVIFFPMFASSIRTQMALQVVQGELAEINERYKDDTLERSRRTAELFTKHKIRPFAMIFSTIVQVAVFIALSYVFFRIGLSHVRADLLYPFVHAPSVISERMFGFIDLTATHSVITGIVVALLQFGAMYLTLARTAAATAHLKPEQKQMQEMQRRMMLYMLPVMMAFIGYSFPVAVGVYVMVTSAVSILQELYFKHKPL